MRSEGSIVIDRSIDEVFHLALDDVTKWSKIVVEDEVIEQTPEGVGTTFRTVTEERGRRMEFDGVITRYESPHVSAIRLTGKMFDLDVEYAFEDLDGKTRVTQASNVNGKGMTKVMFFLFGWLMRNSGCKSAEDELGNLKQYCEAQPSPLVP